MDIKALLNEMTLKEKVGQLNQRLYGWNAYEKTENGISLTDTFKDEVKRWGSLGVLYGVFRSDPWSGANEETGLNKEEALAVCKMIQAYVKDNTRLKIPVLLSEECPHGHQALESTTMPTNISVGASWNPELYASAQEVVAEELREKGAHLSLISTLDVARDPRWGRTEECFSEDPFLTSQFSVAALKGLQGQQAQVPSNKSLAVLKHFAAQGSVMGGHNAGPVSLGERELYDIHLLPMKYSAEAGARLCMAAYNDLDGVPCHGNAHLLTGILRDEFGFDGAVMADGCALDRLVSLTGSREHAAAWALESGVDISLWDQVFPYLEQAVLQGILDEDVLDQAVYRVLKLKEEMGLFVDPHPTIEATCPDEKRILNLKLATESLVLIKNEENVLPLTNDVKKVAVIGPNADSLYNLLGDYTPFKAKDAGVTILQGMKQVFDGEVGCARGTNLTEALPNGIEEALELAKGADVIITALGGCSTRDFSTKFDSNGAALSGSNEMTCGENMDLSNLSIPEPQLALIHALKTLNKPIVAILVQGRPYSLTELESLVDGILVAGYPGEEGGLAIANVVTGKEIPSGKLAMSIPRSSKQLPVYYNYRHAAFKEDYIDESGKALYPFGYGLSYASFDISEVQVEVGKEVVVSGKIKNKSDIKAAEVIQLYVYRRNTRVIPRIKELKGFTKVWLAPYEETEFSIVLTETELAQYESGVGYQLFPGKLELLIEATNFSEKLIIDIKS